MKMVNKQSSLVLETSLLLMKSLNKTETPIFLSVVCSLFPKAIFYVYFSTLQLVLVPCGGGRTSPRTLP